MRNAQKREGRSGAGVMLRVLFSVCFAAVGAGLALTGAGLFPQGAGAASLQGTAAGETATQGSEKSSGTTTSDAERKSAASGSEPVVWYTDNALKVYWPQSGETVKISDLRDGGMDRLTQTYFQDTFNTADGVRVTEDGSKVFFLKNLTTDLLTGMSGELYVTDIKDGAAGKEQLIATGVQKYDLLKDGRVSWVDRNGSMYLQTDGTASAQAEKILSGVTEYRLSQDTETIFAVTDRGSGWKVKTSDGSREKLAAGISSIAYASDDLVDLYYYGNYDYTRGMQDLYYIHDFELPKVVDVDVSEAGFVEGTGHVYYLKQEVPPAPKEEKNSGTNAEESVTEETAPLGGVPVDGTSVEPVPVEISPTEDVTEETAPLGGVPVDDTSTEAAPAETAPAEGVPAETVPVESVPVETAPVEEVPLETAAQDSGAAAGTFSDSANLLGDDVFYTLYFFDGTENTKVLEGVETLDTSRLSTMKKDRAVFWCGLSGNYRIYLADGGKALDTGFSLTDDGLLDFCPDFSEDAIYYIRQEGDAVGTLGPGTVFRKRFTDEGFGEEEKVFSGATALRVVQDGRVYAAFFQENEDTPALLVDGVKVSDHVGKFVWDDSGQSQAIQLYRNVFQSDYYVSGELAEWSGNADDPVTTVAYNVREYHAWDDGSFTMLTDYDEEEEQGNLLYWDGVNAPVTLDTEAVGTKKSEEEIRDAGSASGTAPAAGN